MFLQITASQFADLIKKTGYADNYSNDNIKALYDFLEEIHNGKYEFDMPEISGCFSEIDLDEANTLFELSLNHDDSPQDIKDRIEQAGGYVINIDDTDEDNIRILIAE